MEDTQTEQGIQEWHAGEVGGGGDWWGLGGRWVLPSLIIRRGESAAQRHSMHLAVSCEQPRGVCACVCAENVRCTTRSMADTSCRATRVSYRYRHCRHQPPPPPPPCADCSRARPSFCGRDSNRNFMRPSARLAGT